MPDGSPFTPSVSKPRKLTLKGIAKALSAVLLVWLGVVLGVRYAQTGKLVLGLEKLPFIRQSVTVGLNNPSDRLIGESKPKDEKVNFDTFWEVWSLLERDYLDPEKLDAETMVDGAISGLASSLGDPYTMYLPPEDNKLNGENLAGRFYGVGIELGYVDGTLAVVSPLVGSPAEKAGVKAGDLILHVKDEKKGLDEDTLGWSLDEATVKIRGEKGVPVSLTLFRKDNGQEPFVVDIVRDEIIVKSAEVEFVEHAGKRVAHITLSKFGEHTVEEWNEIVAKIVAEQGKLAGVVLDMRNNSGGFFDTSIDLAGDFFKSGVAVSQKGKTQTRDFPVRGQARLANLPVVVLVNRGSASASEILAGALRDNVGAKLVGEQTFGKGSVQERRELSNGGGIHITIGRWLMPKGESIQDEGLAVDVEAKNDPETLEDEVLLRGIETL